MGIFNRTITTVDNLEYSYSQATHDKINKLADIFYTQHNYVSRPEFDYSESPHPSEKLMYNMAVNAFIFTKKIKPTK